MKRFILKKKSIYRKLVMIFLLIILIVTTFLFAVYMKGVSLVKEEVVKTMRTQNANVAKEIQDETNRIVILQYKIAELKNAKILSELAENASEVEKIESILNIQDMLSSILESSRFIEELYLIIPDSNFVILSNSVRQMNEDDALFVARYPEKKKGQLIYYEDQLAVTVEYPMFYYKGNLKPDFLLQAIVDEDALMQYMNNTTEENSQKKILVDKENRSIIGECPDEVRKIIENSNELDGYNGSCAGYLIAAQDLLKSDFLCVTYVEQGELFKVLNFYRNIMYFLIGGILVCGCVFLVMMYRMIHTPLKKLTEGFADVEEGNFDIAIQHNGYDEFQDIYSRFNQMTAKLKTQIELNYQQEILLQKAQLKQLQSQIAPHFLYNSFLTLSNRIMMGDDEFAAKFSRQLGEYFMFITRNSEEHIPLAQEVRHAEIYADIQQVRFKRVFRKEIEPLPDCYKDILVPRLIIQPIIENVFHYAVEKSEDITVMKLSYQTQEDQLFIIIEDNGKEISDEQISELSLRLSDTKQEVTGIKNIHQRLKIVYGENGGLILERSVLGGLKVKISIGLEK